MPQTWCSVPKCSGKGGHKFPSDAKFRKIWVNAIRRVEDRGGRQWVPSETSVVCRSHFLESDYITTNLTG